MSAEDNESKTLDPQDWDAFSVQAHAAVDMMVEFLRTVRDRPVWQSVPEDVKARFGSPLPEDAQGLERMLAEFRRNVLPYPSGNIHPRFWSWVAGTGTPVGMIADMLAAGMNSLGLGFDESAPSYVELQVLDWFKELFGYPRNASGLLVSGGSMANLVGLAVGRVAKSPYDIRQCGIDASLSPRMVAYGSTETHTSVQKALELLGIGTKYYRRIPVNERFEIEIDALRKQILADQDSGLSPALLVGTAGTVNTGAIDPLSELADIAEEFGLWFVVDGAFGAVAALSRNPPVELQAMQRADAIAFDLHKWLHQPYNAGVVLVADAARHRAAFELTPEYIGKAKGGLASGPVDFSALGVQLSRSFASLRVWATFKTYGVSAFRDVVDQNIAQAQYLDQRVRTLPSFEVLAPTTLNIVNFRFNPGNQDDQSLNDFNGRIVVALQETGVAAPSSTVLRGKRSIRVCITNHRTTTRDLDLFVDAVEQAASRLSS